MEFMVMRGSGLAVVTPMRSAARAATSGTTGSPPGGGPPHQPKGECDSARFGFPHESDHGITRGSAEPCAPHVDVMSAKPRASLACETLPWCLRDADAD